MEKQSLLIESIGQISIAVSDIERAVAFYRDVLELSLLFRCEPGLAFFDCGGVRLMLSVLLGPEQDHHTSVIYYRVKEIEKAASFLISQGLELERAPQLTAKMTDHELWQMFLRDPDGNLIAFMEEKPLSQ